MRMLFCLALVFSFVSCAEDNRIPSDVLPREKMGTVLWQMIMADEYINAAVARDTSLNKTGKRLEMYSKVFELNKISKNDFERSYRFYLGHPDLGKVIFDSLAAQGNRRRQEIYSSKEKKPN